MRRFAHLVLALSAAVPLHSQEFLLRWKPREGMVTHQLMTMETFGPGDLLAGATSDTTLPFLRATLWQTQKISDVTEDDFVITQVLDSMHLESPTLPQLTGMAREANDLMRGTETVARMTRLGFMKRVDVRLPDAMQDNLLASGIQNSLPGVGGGGIGPQMNIPFPERPVQVGETWRDTLALPLAASGPDSSGTATIHTATTLRRVEGPVAVIAVEGRYHLAGPSLPGAMTFTMTSELRFDLEAGHLISTTTEMSGSTQGPTGEIPVRMRMSLVTR